MRASYELAGKIKLRKVGADSGEGIVFSSRDVYLKGWSGLDTPEAFRQAIEVLIDAGWVQSRVIESGPKGGRPAEQYQVNPRIWS
jgi:hypothetical protein